MTAPLPATRRLLEFRSRILWAVRTFFHQRNYTEVETPVHLRTPAQEAHIDAEPAGDRWLRTSPEFHMKRLLAAGHRKIFQIGPCFRQGEQGALHHPEYTMLEWYRTETGYRGIMEETRELLDFVIRQPMEISPAPAAVTLLNSEWRIFSLRDQYRNLAGWDPWEKFDADRFDLDMVNIIEPGLPRDTPAVLMDYPPQCAAFAALNDDRSSAERWELYLGGVEIANAYSELTDPVEQQERLKQAAEQRRAAGHEVYPEDNAFLAAVRSGIPACGGIALGIDRLVMFLAGEKSIPAVMAFCE
jgi:elongation factor P--(R)-beta-lysine ligase